MEYTCKLLYWFRKVQYKPSFFNRVKYRKLQEKHGNEILRQVTIGERLYLGRKGSRYINAGVVIGKNCNIIKSGNSVLWLLTFVKVFKICET